MIARLAVGPASPWQITPLHPDNTAAGPTLTVRAPTAGRGLSRIIAPFSAPTRLPPPDMVEIVPLDAAGHRLELLRFTH